MRFRVRRRSSGLVAAALVVAAWYGITHAPPGLFGTAAAAGSTASTATPADVLAAEKAVYGTGADLGCDQDLVYHESGDRVDATNPSSGAYGLPQSLPAEKMASAGPDWRTNPVTQLRWQKGYVDAVYGGVCPAWAKWQERNPHWY